MRYVALALAWLLATAAATGLAWAGVRSVAADVAAPLPTVVTSTPTDPPRNRAPTDAPTPTSRTRTFETTGGTATVRFSTTGVEVLGAVPATGFAADVEAEDDGSTRVDFESEDHRSRLQVWWRDGPRHEIEERGRDDEADDRSGDTSGPSSSSGSGSAGTQADDDDDRDDGSHRGRGGDED